MLWQKEKLLVLSNFSFSNSVIYSFGELSVIFTEFESFVCKLSIRKNLKFVVWERVQTHFDTIFGPKLLEVCREGVTIYSNNSLVSQKFLRALFEDRHDVRTVDENKFSVRILTKPKLSQDTISNRTGLNE